MTVLKTSLHLISVIDAIAPSPAPLPRARLKLLARYVLPPPLSPAPLPPLPKLISNSFEDNTSVPHDF